MKPDELKLLLKKPIENAFQLELQPNSNVIVGKKHQQWQFNS
jgi:hypothetical protein